MLPFNITIEINEALIQDILNRKEWSGTSIEEKIATRVIDSAVNEMREKQLKSLINFNYGKFNLEKLVTDCIDERLKETIVLHLEKIKEKYIGDSPLEKKIESILKRQIEDKLTEYTQNTLSNLMVINTTQENNQ